MRCLMRRMSTIVPMARNITPAAARTKVQTGVPAPFVINQPATLMSVTTATPCQNLRFATSSFRRSSSGKREARACRRRRSVSCSVRVLALPIGPHNAPVAGPPTRGSEVGLGARLGADAVFDRADVLDLAAYAVARFEKPGWLHEERDAGGRPGDDDVARE